MMEKLRLIFRAFFDHKFKFVLMLFSSIVFLFFLFPFDDLGDLLSAQVYKLSNKQVYVQFDRMDVGVLNPGLKLENFYVETPQIPGLSAQKLSFTPSVMGLVQQKPSGSVTVEGILKGDLEASLVPAGTYEGGAPKHKLVLNAQKISLSELRNLAQIPVDLRGRVSVQSSANADLTFQNQPDLDLVLKINQFELPTGSVNTMMGPLTLPEVRLTTVELKGRLSAGRFQIENGTIGVPGDDLNGTIKGGIALQIKNTNGFLEPILGAYEFTMDLNVKKDLQDRATLFLSFLDQYKTPTAAGARYQFKLSALNPMMPPSLAVPR